MSKEKTSPKRKRTLGQWLDSPNVSGYVFVGPFIIGFLAFMMAVSYTHLTLPTNSLV